MAAQHDDWSMLFDNIRLNAAEISENSKVPVQAFFRPVFQDIIPPQSAAGKACPGQGRKPELGEPLALASRLCLPGLPAW